MESTKRLFLCMKSSRILAYCVELPQHVNGLMASSKQPGLGITPKMGVLGKPAVLVD